MKTETVKYFTYEEIRKALEAQHGPIEGVKVGGEMGYCIVTCQKSEQPRGPDCELIGTPESVKRVSA